MSKIEMKEDKANCTVEGNGRKSEVIITASTITLEAPKITIVGDKTC